MNEKIIVIFNKYDRSTKYIIRKVFKKMILALLFVTTQQRNFSLTEKCKK